MSKGLTAAERSHVLRLCSVFEPEPAYVDGDAARFDPIGGMQNHTAALTRTLDELGVRQTVITSRLAAPRGRTLLGAGAEVRRVGVRTTRFRQFWGVCAVAQVLRVRDVDLVHAHQGEDVATLLLARFASALHRCPLVITLHTSVSRTVTGRSPRLLALRRVGGRLETWALHRADAVITLASRTADLLRADGIRSERVVVIPSGFVPEVFAGPFPDAFPEVPRPRVGFVGRLAFQKRPDVLVQAFGRMNAHASLVVVGDGPLRARVHELVRRSPARDRIHLRGFVPHDEVPSILASLDVLVLPSAYEELGSVLTEALASGLPIVASDVGGIPEVVGREGDSGVLVPPGDVQALARELDCVLGDEQQRRRLSAGARRRADDFSWPSLARRVLGVYADVLMHTKERDGLPEPAMP